MENINDINEQLNPQGLNKDNSITDNTIGNNTNNKSIEEKSNIDVDLIKSIADKHTGNKTKLLQGFTSDVDIREYKDYIQSFRGDTPIDRINKARASNQSVWEQVGNFGVQAFGEIVGGAVEGIGSMFELPNALIDTANGKDADFNNFLMEFGQSIQDWSKDGTEIYQQNPGKSWEMNDFGWWLNNGVSMASTVSLLIPAAGTVRAVGMIGKILNITDKVGDATKYWMKAGGSAMIMRNAENMTESLQVSEKTKKSAYDIFGN